MSNIIFYTILSLSALGVLSAVILYFIAQKFKVDEDPRIDQVEAVLPGANCGGCGYPGCRKFAEEIVKTGDLSAFHCPVGGNTCMNNIAAVLGVETVEKKPMTAVLLCNGTLANRPKTSLYDSAQTCAIATSTYSGDTGCSYGCLGLGDCVTACPFDAIVINEETGLPDISEEKCTGCGNCVTACPKNIIELRNTGPKSRRVYVSCINKDKGGVARKACKAACIGCGKCVKECPFEAITLENNLAYIDFQKCKLCRKCVSVCPTGAITEINFPPKKEPQEQVRA